MVRKGLAAAKHSPRGENMQHFSGTGRIGYVVGGDPVRVPSILAVMD